MSDPRTLDPDKIIETIGALHRRISERFKGSGLANVCQELGGIAKQNAARATLIVAPNLPLRAAIVLVLVVGAAGLSWIGLLVAGLPTAGENAFSLLQGIESAANLTVLVGAALFFLIRSEERTKRRQALSALHELRSIMHVIDMHQLTKDPSAMSISSSTPSSPARALSRDETARYLDYCSEMLSLTAKVAVLFGQGFPDPAVVDAISDVERLATGLSQKIWQKIMILETEPSPAPGGQTR